MKLSLIAILALLFGGSSFAANSNPIKFSKVETYNFRNGVYPDASYSGMTMLQISEAAKTTSYASWTKACLGDTTGARNRMRVLWKCDVSAIPDSAIIDDAVLRVPLAYSTTSSVFRIQGYRVLLNWSSSATWNTRGTAGTDSTWTANNAAAGTANWGLADSSGTEAEYRSGTIPLLDSRSGKWPLTTSTNYTESEGGYVTLAGSDSSYSAEEWGSAGAARSNEALFNKLIRTGSNMLNDTTWVEFKMTEAVRAWKTKAWANFGIVFTAELIDSSTDSFQDYDANTLWTTTRPQFVTPNYAYHNLYARRPMLSVRLLYAIETPPDTVVTNGGGGGRLTIGG